MKSVILKWFSIVAVMNINCHTRENSMQHPISLWKNNQQYTFLCHHAIWFLVNLWIHRWPKYSFSSVCLTVSPLKGRCDFDVVSLQLQIKPSLRLQTWETEGTQKLQTTPLFLLTNSVALVIILYPKTTVESIERSSTKSVSGFLLARVCKSRLCLQLTGHLSNACSILFSKLLPSIQRKICLYIHFRQHTISNEPPT